MFWQFRTFSQMFHVSNYIKVIWWLNNINVISHFTDYVTFKCNFPCCWLFECYLHAALLFNWTALSFPLFYPNFNWTASYFSRTKFYNKQSFMRLRLSKENIFKFWYRKQVLVVHHSFSLNRSVTAGGFCFHWCTFLSS